MKYVEIDGRYYFSPCDDCVVKSCYSCVIRKYQADLREEREKINSAEFRLTQELEPRLAKEKSSYDMWITQVAEEED